MTEITNTNNNIDLNELQNTQNALDHNFIELLDSYKQELQTLESSIQQVTEEKQALAIKVDEANETIESLKQVCLGKEQIIGQMAVDYDRLIKEKEGLEMELHKNLVKYSTLETSYDKNILQMRENNNTLMAQVAEAKLECENLNNKFEMELYNVSQQLSSTKADLVEAQEVSLKVKQEYVALHERFEQYKEKQKADQTHMDKQYQEKINKLMATIKDSEEALELCMKKMESEKGKDFTIEKIQARLDIAEEELKSKSDELLRTQEKNEIEINQLKEQLNQKEEEVQMCLQEKKTIEEQKNKIIEEQQYRMREIERVFTQPVQRVVPTKLMPPENSELIENGNIDLICASIPRVDLSPAVQVKRKRSRKGETLSKLRQLSSQKKHK